MNALADRAPVAAPPAVSRAGGLVAALLLTAAASAVFYYRQNYAGQVGGAISVEKTLWLNYTITAWFVVPAFLTRHRGLEGPLRRVFGGFLLSMIARGVAELWLIYVTFGWSPLYGIAHDVFNIVLIAVLRRRASRDGVRLDALNRAARRFATTIQLSLVAEIVFAALFYRMDVHRAAVYFAPPTEAFAHINLLTRGVDAVVYADLVQFLWRYSRARFARPAPITGAPVP